MPAFGLGGELDGAFLVGPFACLFVNALPIGEHVYDVDFGWNVGAAALVFHFTAFGMAAANGACLIFETPDDLVDGLSVAFVSSTVSCDTAEVFVIFGEAAFVGSYERLIVDVEFTVVEDASRFDVEGVLDQLLCVLVEDFARLLVPVIMDSCGLLARNVFVLFPLESACEFGTEAFEQVYDLGVFLVVLKVQEGVFAVASGFDLLDAVFGMEEDVGDGAW